MSTVTVSTKRNRVYQRKFDHDEARELRAQGWTYTALEERFGVSYKAVRRVCDPVFRAGFDAGTIERQRRGTCPDCGKQTTRRSLGDARCIECAALARATSVRPDALHCSNCGEWKPDKDFPHNRGGRKARRGRHSLCRSCATVARREYRQRNREATRAYDREYKRRKRAAA